MAFCAFLGVFQPVAFPVGLDDVDAVRDAVEQRAGHAFIAKYFGPVLEGQVGGEQYALAFVGAADDFKQQLGAGLGKRDVAELVEDDEVVFGQPVEEPFELAFFAGPQGVG